MTRVGFIGLGAMGGGMAAALVKKGFEVCGFDVYGPAVAMLKEVGGLAAATCTEAASGCSVLVVMVTTAQQAESVLFGPLGALEAMPQGSVVVLCSTVSPGFSRSLEARIQDLNRDIAFVDAPVSGGVARAAAGSLSIMASGTDVALLRGRAVLEGMSEKLHVVGSQAGAGSCVKMVNQLLAGVHIATAAEAMALGARAGLNTRMLFEIISHAAGNSWMFENRVPHMIDNDYTPRSALNIFVKDLGIVLGQAQTLGFPLPMASAALQQFLAGAAAGLGKEDDAAVVKVYEKLAGISVASPAPTAPAAPHSGTASSAAQARPQCQLLSQLLPSLPPVWPRKEGTEEARAAGQDPLQDPLVVILDDDPTGTQTVHDVQVLTKWDVPFLVEAMSQHSAAFFILTNSRALPTDQAAQLTSQIYTNLVQAAKEAGVEKKGLSVILRGDSTLRGHFPEEMDAACSVMGEFDAWIVCPFFLEGGRYTVGDTHYVADGDKLVPAGETEFAKDAVFGYTSSNLKDWIAEKSKGRFEAANVASLSLTSIRSGGPDAVCDALCRLPKGSVCIVNAASNDDLAVVTAGIIKAEHCGKRFLCRTAASFVSARLQITPKAPLGPHDFPVPVSNAAFAPSPGGLIVVGSYVPNTTKQVELLLSSLKDSLHVVSIDAATASSPGGMSETELDTKAKEAQGSIEAGRDTVIMTTRQLISGPDASASLTIGQQISDTLIAIVRRIQVRPRYILAKGGITSSDVATKALNVDKALVAGQAMPGVPLWTLGPNSRFPSLPYIVFPGNVGGAEALRDVVRRWHTPQAMSRTAAILREAAHGRYAVGAFNVYDLVGVEAVVAAATAEQSPAIIQLHPAALEFGGAPLVAACLSAIGNAKVPLALHLDHGVSSEGVLDALNEGFHSVMVDGSSLPFGDNAEVTKRIAQKAHQEGVLVEAELGRIAGVEDGVTAEDTAAKMTDPTQALDFMTSTGIDALAVCIGNRHGPYPPEQLAQEHILDLRRLEALKAAADSKGVYLVLHGASGLPETVVKDCIQLGVRKFNVNTEVRAAYLAALSEPSSSASKGKDLVEVLRHARDRMSAVIRGKIRVFGSSGKAVL